MGIRHAARVAELIRQTSTSDHQLADAQHSAIMNCILGNELCLANRVHQLISFETITRSKDEPYITSMIEALILAHNHEGVPLLQAAAAALKRHKHPELWMMYPLTIIGILRASNYIEAGREVNLVPFGKELPWFIGGLVRDYIDAAHVNIKESNQCSKWALGELNNALAAYLGPNPTTEKIRRARELMAIMDECNDKIQKPVHKVVSQFTHRVFSLLNMRAQIANLKHGFDNLEIEPAFADGPSQVM